MGLDTAGNVMNNTKIINSWESMFDTSYKVISFVDCGGYEKYHRSSLQYLLSYMPDYIMLVISALKTYEDIKHQLELAIALRNNFSVIITHVDLVTEAQLNQLIEYVD